MKRILGAIAVLLTTGITHASLITVDFDGNDCAGVFGQGFEDCTVNGSPIIAKYEDGSVEINSLFASILGDEFTINGDGTGDWSYNQGANDPNVRYWVAKGGPVFRLHYMVDDANDAACAGSASAACLGLAQVVTSGVYSTPINPSNGNNYGLSHISFYDSGASSVPEPGTLLLFSLGLLGLGIARHRTA